MTIFKASSPSITQMIVWQADWRGNDAAIVFNRQTCTWKSFHLQTNRIANLLISRGVGKGQRVVVLMENSTQMIEVLFGVIKAGASVVPINLSVSDEALSNQIMDSQATTIIATEKQSTRVNKIAGILAINPQLLKISYGKAVDNWLDFESLVGQASKATPDVQLQREDECNVIYSSGTTGLPKGIVHLHGPRFDWAYDLTIALRFHSGARTICSLGLYSNISWVSMLCSILTGGLMVVQEKFSAEEFIELVEEYQLTHCAGVPIQYQRVFDNDRFTRNKLSSLQMLMCCGSPMSESLKQMVDDNIGCDLIELYGLTEGVITTLAPEDRKRKPSSVGKPLPGTQIAILNANDQLAMSGCSGEIIARGRILMAGYLNRPDADREASWQDQQGNVWLRTGDIGKLDKQGFLYLVDRKKDMIISGGQNIYPQDLEKTLLSHPDISEAAVIGVNSQQWGETPLALVVARKEANLDSAAVSASVLDVESIRGWANQKLGKQQKIAEVKQVISLPRNPNGKLEKKRIREEYKDYTI